MVTGEFKYKIEDFNQLIEKEQEVIKRFENYCRQHNKIIESEILITMNPVLFILKFKIINK
jgi:hypothetical protein